MATKYGRGEEERVSAGSTDETRHLLASEGRIALSEPTRPLIGKSNRDRLLPKRPPSELSEPPMPRDSVQHAHSSRTDGTEQSERVKRRMERTGELPAQEDGRRRSGHCLGPIFLLALTSLLLATEDLSRRLRCSLTRIRRRVEESRGGQRVRCPGPDGTEARVESGAGELFRPKAGTKGGAFGDRSNEVVEEVVRR